MDQNALLMVVLLVFVGGMMYMSSRTRKRQMAAQQAKLAAVAPGVRVTTIAGLQGLVTAVADDTMELEIAPGVRTIWLRSAVRDIVLAPDAAETSDYEADQYEADDYEAGEDGASSYPTVDADRDGGSSDTYPTSDKFKKDLG